MQDVHKGATYIRYIVIGCARTTDRATVDILLDTPSAEGRAPSSARAAPLAHRAWNLLLHLAHVDSPCSPTAVERP